MSAPSPPQLTAAGTPYVPRAAVAVLAVLAGTAATVTYVETMVLPAIKQFISFFDGAPLTTVSWILSAYLLVGTVSTPIFGKLGDKFGKKRMLLVVMGVYAVAVALAGFTPDLGSAAGISRGNQIYLLIGVRAVQGVGMAMFPLAFAMIPETFPAARVGPAQGAVSAMFAVGAAFGLAVGGWVAQSFGWQFTYHTVIPIALVLFFLAWRLLHESPHRHPHPIDLPGIAALGLSLTMFLLGITEGASWGWTNLAAVRVVAGVSWGVPQFFVLAGIGLVAFLLWEPRSPWPVISFRALRERNILVSNVAGILAGLTMFLVFLTNTILAEDPLGPGFGLTESRFGLIAVPSALGMLAFGPVFGVASSRYGPKPTMLAGFALVAAGAAALAAFHSTLLELAVLPIPILVGVVGTMIAMTNVIVLTADRKELGIQTGMNQTFRNLGSAVGPVLATSVIASFTTVYLLPPALGGPTVGPTDTGFVLVFVLVAVLALVGLLVSLGLRNFRFAADGTRHDAASPAKRGGPATVSSEEIPVGALPPTR